MSGADYQRAFYDAHFAKRADAVRDQLAHPLFRSFNDRVAELVLAEAGGSRVRVYEPGCGEGLVASALARVAARRGIALAYTGADLSGAALALAATSVPGADLRVGDAAEAFAQSLTNPETIGQAYNLVGPREYTFRELLLLVRNTLGLHKPLLPVPLVLMDLLVPVMNLLPFSPITLDQYQMLKAGNTAEPDAMLKTFRLEWRGLEAELPAILKFRPINL